METLDRALGKVRIIKIYGGEGIRRRLYDLGLIEGVTVEVVKNDFGPIIVKVRGNKVAIGRGIAKKILVAKA
ncbi:FeoA family protein [Methanocaldococcus sp.]